jgi:general secretion pathway protein E
MVTEPETDIILETPAAEQELGAPAEQRALPFSFAKRHGVLIRELTSDGADAVYRAGASPLSIAEVRRYMGVPLKLSRVSPDIFDSLLQASYEQGSQKAMEMVGGLDDEFDLTQVAQELEPSDLLDSDDDAPIIRFINAVLTEAIKENASDVHIAHASRAGTPRRVAYQGDVEAGYRGKAAAAGRPHIPEDRRTRRGRACIDFAFGPW